MSNLWIGIDDVRLAVARSLPKITDDQFNNLLDRIRAEVWDEAYWQGVEAEFTASEANLGYGPNRNNPYRKREN